MGREATGMFKRIDGYYTRKTYGVGDYNARQGTFSSKQFSFDLEQCEAYSYDWWLFVLRVGDVIYFNNAHYSMQTHTHQNMAKNILAAECPEQFGIKVVYVYIREGLHRIGDAIDNIYGEIDTIQSRIANPKSKKATNLKRVQTIKELRAQIVEYRQLKKLIDRQLTKNYKARQRQADSKDIEVKKLELLRQADAHYKSLQPNVVVDLKLRLSKGRCKHILMSYQAFKRLKPKKVNDLYSWIGLDVLTDANPAQVAKDLKQRLLVQFVTERMQGNMYAIKPIVATLKSSSI